jgi:hypothetical protein
MVIETPLPSSVMSFITAHEKLTCETGFEDLLLRTTMF